VAEPLRRLEEKYEILGKLSEGGMGSIYKVRHLLLDEVRVIKVMHSQLGQKEGFEERFRREAKMAIRLRHDNIAQFYDFSVDQEGNAYIVMEYIDGVNLLDLLRRHGILPLGFTLEVARQALKALGYLHGKGIVHRDVSPDNLMLTRDDDGNPLVKLIDLGVAKALEGGGELTTTGIFVGKLKYCSPEQLRQYEGAEISARSDLYSLSVVLYELLTGRLPIRGENLTSIMAGHLFEPPVPFTESDPDGCIPEDLRRVVLRSLAKDPEARHESARHMSRELASVQARFPFVAEDFVRLLIPEETHHAGRGSGRRVSGHGSAIGDRHGLSKGAAPDRPAEEAGRKQGSRATPEPVRAAAESNQRRCEALYAEARRLAAEGHLPQAASQARVLLQLDPGSRRATELLEQLEREMARRNREREHAASLSSVVDLISNQLEAGDLNAAMESLREARDRFDGEQRLDGLEERIHSAENATRKQQAQNLLAEARVMAEVYQFDEAVAVLAGAIELDPRDTALRRELENLERLRTEHRERAAHEAAVARAAGEVESLLDRSLFDEARAALDRAEEALGAADVFTALRGRADALEQHQREQKVAGLLARAREAVDQGRFVTGVRALEEALELCPDDLLVQQVLAETRERAERHAEEARRRAALQSLEGEVLDLIRDERWGDAAARLGEARDELGEAPELASLEQRLEEARSLALRLGKARGLLDRAEAALEADDLALALDALGSARELEIMDSPLGDRLRELDGRLRQAVAEQQRQRELAAAVERVESCLDSGDLEGADRALEVAEKLFPGETALRSLRQRVETMASAPGPGPAAEILSEVRSAMDGGHWEQALGLLNQARSLEPGNPEVPLLLREARISQAIATIESSLQQGDVESAARAVELARRLVGDDPRLDEISRRIDEAGGSD